MTQRWILLSQPDHSAEALRFDAGQRIQGVKIWRFGRTWLCDLFLKLPDLDGCGAEVRALNYVRFTFTQRSAMSIRLRGYQTAAIEGARAELRKGTKRLIISAPTGAGKTEIAMALIQAAVDKGSRVSFVADRRSLVQQTSRRFTEAGIQHGILMGNDTVGTWEPVRVESAQTIQKRGLRAGTDLFVMDEVHEVRPDIIKQIAESGATLIGLTATPFPAALAEPIDSHLPAEQQKPDAPPRYEAMVSTVTTDQLIADGHLCPFDVVAPVATVDTSGVKVQGGEFHKPTLKDRIMRIVGEIVPTWREQLDERFGGEVQPTIVFGATVDDAEAIQSEFRDAGYAARLVSSREDEDDNKATIEAFREGEFDVLVNCAMLSRGMDFPRAADPRRRLPDAEDPHAHPALRAHHADVPRQGARVGGRPRGKLAAHARQHPRVLPRRSRVAAR